MYTFHSDAPPEEMAKYRSAVKQYKKSCGEANSLWWSALYKLSIANKVSFYICQASGVPYINSL